MASCQAKERKESDTGRGNFGGAKPVVKSRTKKSVKGIDKGKKV